TPSLPSGCRSQGSARLRDIGLYRGVRERGAPVLPQASGRTKSPRSGTAGFHESLPPGPVGACTACFAHPAPHSFLAMPVTSMTAGTVPLFSIQWLVFRSAVNVSPGPYSFAMSARFSMIFDDRIYIDSVGYL